MGSRNGESVFNGAEVLIGKMRKFGKWIMSTVARHCECIKAIKLYT